MIHMLGHYLNKLVLVSIPSIFGDDTARACKLTGIEPSGLWLESEDFATTLLEHDDKRAAPHVFIPFHQIAFLLEPARIHTRSLLIRGRLKHHRSSTNDRVDMLPRKSIPQVESL